MTKGRQHDARQPSPQDRSGQHTSGTPGSARGQGTPAGNRSGQAQEGGAQSVERDQGPRKR
ncbi:MAG: hypothetical protein K0R03_287 [Moraxellaceae bacterium]|jgi:hypothetical protein|nr:hypothetical protein [Moraxellaceae bacterium]